VQLLNFSLDVFLIGYIFNILHITALLNYQDPDDPPPPFIPPNNRRAPIISNTIVPFSFFWF